MRVHLPGLVGLSLSALATAQHVPLPFDAPQVAFNSTLAVTNLGDFDADGTVDYLGWYWDLDNVYTRGHIQVLHNDGTGAIDSSSSMSILSNGGAGTRWAIDVGPIDASPGDDAVLTFDDQVSIFTFPIGWLNGFRYLGLQINSTWHESVPVTDAKLADLDGDGDLDLALAGGNSVRVFRNDGGSYAAIGSYAIGATTLMQGDVDGDGRAELILPMSGAFAILHWNGIALVQTLTIQHGVMPSEDPMPVFGDIDGDGDGDLCVFAEAGTYVVARCLQPNLFQVEGRRFGGPATGLSDIDGDGDLDGVCCGGGGPGSAVNNRPSTFHISINRGGGEFAPATTMEGLGAFHLAGVADVDHDSTPDLVAGRAIWFGHSNFGFDTQPDLPTVTLASPLRTSDVDRDGDPDLSLPGAQVLRNDGSGALRLGSLRFPPPPSGSTFEHDGIRGDLDGDGDEDRIVVHMTGTVVSGMRLLLNLGGGAFVDGGYATTRSMLDSVPTGAFDRRHVVADFDGDGDLDVLTGSTQSFQAFARMWWNDGQGHLSEGPTQLNLGVPMATADFDGDGHVDVVTDFGIWFGNGSGTFTIGWANTSFDISPTVDTVALGDLDHDGRLELAYRQGHSPYEVRVVSYRGSRQFSMSTVRSLVSDPNRDLGVAIADLDGDGNNDLLVWPGSVNDGAHSVLMLFGDGAGAYPRNLVQVADISGPLVDVDGDGDLDALGRTAVTRGAARVPMRDGFRLQYGVSSTTHDGYAPTLGARGPFAAGQGFELLLSGAVGGSPVALAIGAAPAAVRDWPLPGLVGLVDTPVVLAAGSTDGAAGALGVGDLALPLVAPPGLSQATLFSQAYVLDVVHAEIAATNGLATSFR
ncbi:MAG: VCBS repeat-containing protein [Planctomycetota bacterium]